MSAGARSSPPSGVVTALARFEGRRLIGHPMFLAGVAFALIGSGMFVKASLTRSPISWNDDGWTIAAGFILLGILTMVASNHAALRDRREHTEEQHASLPVGAPARTGGLLAAMLWPAAVTTVLLSAVAGFATARGVRIGNAEAVQLVGFVWLIPMLGALGIAIAAWFSNPFVAPLVGWALFLFTPNDPPASWHSLTPFADLRTVDLAAWHLLYLAGLTAIIGLVALARSSRLRTLLVPGIVAIAVVAISAAILLARVCSVGSRCLL